jgi:hypothetical protein
MTVWIITTGSSDVQLKTEANWSTLFSKVRGEFFKKTFPPSKNGKLWTVPARVMGTVYSQSDASAYFDDLVFPLLDNFVGKIQSEKLSQIILILTDQENVFPISKRCSPTAEFWKDTCTLQPILKRYLETKYPDTEILDPLILKPESPSDGLDDWDSVFKMVQSKFSKLNFPEDETIYVSHQAGTPAISSAIQFASLARFGQRVEFLVSSARDVKLTYKLKSSAFLKGLKLQEAKALLERYDYAGVKELLGPYLNPEAEQLLNAAIQWNCSKFDEFACLLGTISGQRTETWWWTAYEAAYLAVIRHRQKDIVDAFFHSFRSIEGAFSEWGKNEFKAHTEIRNERPYLQTTILSDPKGYFSTAKFKQDGKPKDDLAKLKCKLEELQSAGKDIILYGENLYPLFRLCRGEYKSKCSELSQFWDSNNGISEKRNKIFHQLKGLSEIELKEAWNVLTIDDWQPKILSYLNFITGQSHFPSLSEASLMAQVHQQLETAIASLAQSPN